MKKLIALLLCVLLCSCSAKPVQQERQITPEELQQVIAEYKDEKMDPGDSFSLIEYSFEGDICTALCQPYYNGTKCGYFAEMIIDCTDGVANADTITQKSRTDIMGYTSGENSLIMQNMGGTWKAKYIENYQVKAVMDISEEEIPLCIFLESGNDMLPETVLENDIATINTRYSYTRFVIDFAHRTYNTEYLLTRKDVLSKPEGQLFPYIDAQTDDKMIVSTPAGGGGDAYYDDLWLFTDADEKPVHLEVYGGMYSGGSGCGFFKNGDVYVISNVSFHVYQNGERTFSLEDVFPLGKVTEEEYLYVNAVRRNEDNTFTVLYSPLKSNYSLDEETWSADSDYMLMVIDRQGNISKKIDTGERIRINYFGLCPVSMYLKDENTIRFMVSFKGEVMAEKDIAI